ncbi:hypothetical protein KVR01_004214 [Diaporthe batatas]|uniref:uncharacterized protein n=1 Tax=Diaporthe batatas TaxID=748121 RepID=UPI001D040781|nr:uncharacterized protein KVR01_004214 [Diaporthe batatas]KAG8165662.1 hypothetical protein KVR01_004214 [Diaporthe batatas]
MADCTVNSQIISDITNREKTLTSQDDPVKGGPTSQAQRHVHDNISSDSVVSGIAKGDNNGQKHTGTLDGQTISEINSAESKLTGQRKHANEPINADMLLNITEGEKNVAGERIKGGSTAIAQSELAKSRSS